MNTIPPKTILLVEDEMIIAMAEKRKLEQEGYQVLVVASGEEAITLVSSRTGPIDLILMDIDLGKGMDGTQAARLILRDRAIPILFLSSHIEEQIVEKTEAISSYGYVVKESSFTVLKASIKMAFRLHASNQRVARSALRFEAIKQTSMDGFLVVGLDGRILETNDAYCIMTGYRTEELLRMSIPELEAVETVEVTAAHIMRIQENGADRFESVHRRKDGSLVDVEVNVTIEPESRSMMVFLNDITKRKQAEQALREESALRQVLFQYSPDGIVILDPNTARILEFNEAAHRQLGYSREEFMTMRVPDIEAMESEEDTRRRISTVLRTGREDFLTRQRTRDGRVRDIEVTAQVVSVAGKTVYHCIWRDVTESRQRAAATV
jgi:PAS domain S-box-containing protein